MKMDKIKKPREGGRKISTIDSLLVNFFNYFRGNAVWKRLEISRKSG